MTPTDYAAFTRTTAVYPPEHAVPYLALGLSSEAGEVAGKVKKTIRGDAPNPAALIAELGDVLWYLTRLIDELGLDYETLARLNADRLKSRQARGVIRGDGDDR